MKIFIFFLIFIFHKNLGVKGGIFPLHGYTKSVRPTNQTDCGCGYAASQNHPSERIFGGEEVDSEHSLPFMVQLIIEWNKGHKNVTCGGTLINRRLVITAAVCVTHRVRELYGISKQELDEDKKDFFPAKIYAFMGTHITKFNGSGSKLEKYEELQVIIGSNKTILTPNNYGKSILDADIALLQLPRNVEFNAFITPACLSSCKKDLIGKTAIIAGWGRSENPYDFQDPDDFLKQATINIIPPNHPLCKRSWYYKCRGYVINRGLYKKICGHSLTSNICVGDAGGPLIMKENGRYVIVGVASCNGGCRNFQKAGIYTDICPYIDAILDYSRIIKGWCESPCKQC